MKEKSNHLKSIQIIVAIALVVSLFIFASKTSSKAFQLQVDAGGGHTVGVKSDDMVMSGGNKISGKRNMFDRNLQPGIFEDIPPGYWSEVEIYKKIGRAC